MLETLGDVPIGLGGLLAIPIYVFLISAIWILVSAVALFFKPFNGMKLFDSTFDSSDFAISAFVALFIGPIAYLNAVFSDEVDKLSSILGVTMTCLAYLLIYFYMTSV